ncbi:MAG: glycoside hydrolase family 95 protein [Ruminococcaceae bacterium]|jgi:alpha-L-fucosidase 2|nr:glycoside hydrolase family 95 protein [Oscillospiraceae bacterium]
MSRHIYTLNRPASWPHEEWREALPLGNGLTGVLIPGSIAAEHITFNRHDLWHGGSDGGEIPDITETFRAMRDSLDRGDYAAANQDNLMAALREKGYSSGPEVPYPLGWLNLTFTPEGMFRHYRRGVNMRTGEAFVEFEIDGCRYSRRMFVSRDSDIAVLRMTADRAFTASYDFSLYSETGEAKVGERFIRKVSKDGESAASMLFCGDIQSEVRGESVEVTGREYLVLIRASSHGLPLSLDEFAGESYGALLEKHTALHTPLYDAVTVELAEDSAHDPSNEAMLDEAYDDEASPAFFERLWRFGRYLFISAASGCGNPVPLYGLWHGADWLPWAQYVANENVQMTYWHAMAGGLSYAVPPLLRYYASKVGKFRECARKMFGMRGIWISAYTTPNVAGPCVPVAVIGNWISCAGWLCRHFWEYYLYTGDEALLKEEILPFMREAALFWLDYAEEGEDGTLLLRPSVSPENTSGSLLDLPTKSATGHPCPAAKNATMDFAVMKELFTNLLEGIRITGLYADEAEAFRTALGKIPAYRINEDGAVKEWMDPTLSDNYAHRHLSHIYPVFPGGEVTAKSDPELFEAFRKAVHLRELGSQCNWSLTHMAAIYDRLGEGEAAAECLDLLAKSVLLPSFFTVCNDWRHMGMTLDWKDVPIQLDAVFGAVNAVQEMLFRWEKTALSVLPALPKRLKSGAVRGMAFPGGTIDIRWDTEGAAAVTVHAARALDTDVLIAGKSAGHIRLEAGEDAALTLRL